MSRVVRRLTIACAVVAFGAFTGSAYGQPGPGGPSGDRAKRGVAAQRLNLSDTQREQIRNLREDHRAALKQPLQQLREARRQWHAEATADQPDPNRLQQLRSEVLRLSQQLEASRLEMQEQRLSILTAEQRQTLRQQGGRLHDGGGWGVRGKGLRRPGGGVPR